MCVSAGRFPEGLLSRWTPARASALSTKKISSEIQSEKRKSYIVKYNFGFWMIQTDTDVELKAASSWIFFSLSCVWPYFSSFLSTALESPPVTDFGCGKDKWQSPIYLQGAPKERLLTCWGDRCRKFYHWTALLQPSPKTVSPGLSSAGGWISH